MSDLRKTVAESKAARKAMERRFGFVPTSVLRISRGALSKQMYIYQHEVTGRQVSAGDTTLRESLSEDAAKNAQARSEAGMFGGVVTKTTKHGRLGASTMPAELVDFFIKYYAEPGQVYLDPFMGQGVQMQVAALRGLDYWGYDLSTEFFRYIEATRDRIAPTASSRIEVFHGDSRFPDRIPDGIGDFSFHSPPYWDIEYYGDEEGQLGLGTYEEFLDGMEAVARAWLPKFKPGAWHVVNINDFRRQGRFYPYHADTIRVFTAAGWELVDTWIIDGLVGGLSRVFGVSRAAQRIAPKVHEYALVFRAPVTS